MSQSLILCDSFDELSGDEVFCIVGGLTAEQWIMGTCVVVGAVVGTVAGAGVCILIGVKAGSVVGIAICSAIGIGTGALGSAVGKSIINS